jgi:hypothetical protein
LKITIDGSAVVIGDSEPVPYDDLAEVNKLIESLHFATPPELLGAPVCKACPGEDMRSFATNGIAYRRTGTSVAVLVNLCPVHLVPERVFADIFRWTLHVLPEPLSLTAQYLFALDVSADQTALEAILDGHRDVLAALAGDDLEAPVPAAAAGNTGDAGKEAPPELSSSPGDGGKISASGNPPGPLPRRRPVAGKDAR